MFLSVRLISGCDGVKRVKLYHSVFTLNFEHVFIICNNRQISVIFLDFDLLFLLPVSLAFQLNALISMIYRQTEVQEKLVFVLLNLEAGIFISENK